MVLHDFDDLVDGSGNGHDALLGGDAFIEDGRLWLDGDEDYADIGTLAGFGAVNPLVDALSDFTIAVAYASEATDGGEGGSMLVSIGPAAASASSDLVGGGTVQDAPSVERLAVKEWGPSRLGGAQEFGRVELTPSRGHLIS